MRITGNEMDKLNELKSLLSGTRNLPGVGVLQPQYQPEDITDTWLRQLEQPIPPTNAAQPTQQVDLAPLDIGAVAPKQLPTIPAKRVQPLKSKKSKLVPLPPQAPQSAYADLIKQMEQVSGQSQKDKIAQLSALSQMGQDIGNIETPTSYSGIYKYINSNTGMNFADPENMYKDRQALLDKLMASLPETQGKIREDQMGMLKTKLGVQASEIEAAAKAKESSLDRQLKLQIAKMELAAKQKEAGLNLSPMQKRIDWSAAKDYNDFWLQGGHATTETAIDTIQEAIQKLKNTPEGTLSGPKVALMPRPVRAYTNPDSVDLQDNINLVAARGLKALFPGAISDSERQFLTETQYNPKLTHAQNAAKLERLLARLKSEYDNKKEGAAWFESEKTMKGYKGTMGLSAQIPKTSAATPASQDYSNMSDEDLFKLYQAKKAGK